MLNKHHHLIVFGLVVLLSWHGINGVQNDGADPASEQSSSSSSESGSKGCSAGSSSSSDSDSRTYERSGGDWTYSHTNRNVNVNKMSVGGGAGNADGDDGWVRPNVTVPENVKASQCKLWLPFEDEKVMDHSAYGRGVRASGTYNLEDDTMHAAHGRGSLRLHNGYVEVEDMKDAFTCGRQTTMCFFWRCRDCREGTIFTNRRGATGRCRDKKRCGKDYSLTVEVVRRGDRQAPRFGIRVTASFKGRKPVYVDVYPDQGRRVRAPSPRLPFGFDQYCIVYDGERLSVSVNSNQRVVEFTTKGALRKLSSKNSAVFGRDRVGGWLDGWLDEILVCDRVLTRAEMNAHYAGKLAMEYAGMVPATTTLFDYKTVTPVERDAASLTTLAPVCGHNSYWNAGEQLQPLLGIVGGREAEDWEFPWTVLFHLRASNHYCHGSLVTNNSVVTSGHCCLQLRRDRQAGDVFAYLGIRRSGLPLEDRGRYSSQHYFPAPSDYERKQKVIREDIHPSYHEQIVRGEFSSSSVNRTRAAQYFSSEHNLCVVTLEDPVLDGPESWRVVPVCLPDCQTSAYERCEVGDAGLVAGFGQQAYNEWDWSFMGDRQRVITVPKISAQACKASLHRWYPHHFSQQVNFRENFCAGFVNKGLNSAACYTDDGTGFLCNKPGFFQLEGVLSGWDCSATPGSPSQFADICGATNWDFILNAIVV